MAGIAVRSVNLTQETTQAWKDADVQFARRGRGAFTLQTMALEQGYEFLLNLGKSEFNWQPELSLPVDNFLWNEGRNIVDLLWPGMARRLLNDLMPPQPTTFPAEVWIKAPGMKGKGKYKKEIDHSLILPNEWDWQVHVEGTEYRVLTVGKRVVQAFIKTGSHTDRSYEWVGVKGTPPEAKQLVRDASKRLNGHNVVGWDLVVPEDQPPMIFEGNSCPGVNAPTAERIVREIRRQIQEERENDADTI